MKIWATGAVLLAVGTGCASAAPAPEAAPRAPASPMLNVAVAAPEPAEPVVAAAPEPAEPEPEAIPTECAGQEAIKKVSACLPPASFVKKTCAAPSRDLALSLFAKGTPWTRVWLAGDVEAWSASGGFTSRSKVAFDEEVLVLSRHAAPSSGGITMSGAIANYDVMRADGSCVSISEGELTTRRPPTPRLALVKWNRLEEATRTALLSAPKVKTALAAMQKACGIEETRRAGCEKTEKALTAAVAGALRSGQATVPAPTRRP